MAVLNVCVLSHLPFLNSSNGMKSNKCSTASLASALPFLCTCFIRSWKFSLITSPSSTKGYGGGSCFTTAEISSCMCPKFVNSFPFLLNISTLPSGCTIAKVLTPSSLTSNIFLPTNFFSWFAESWASWQVNTGTMYLPNLFFFATEFTVFSETPQRKSLINILL